MASGVGSHYALGPHHGLGDGPGPQPLWNDVGDNDFGRGAWSNQSPQGAPISDPSDKGIRMLPALNPDEFWNELAWNHLHLTTWDAARATSADELADRCLLSAVIQRRGPLVGPEHGDGGAGRAIAPDEPIGRYHSVSGEDHWNAGIQFNTIGYIYVAQSTDENYAAQEVNIGISLMKEFCGRGYGKRAVKLVLKWAFKDMNFHRVQAAILDCPDKERLLRMYTKLGFTREGTRRRAAVSPIDGTWADVTHLAILDTDWALLSTSSPSKQEQSIWDEMLTRHQKETEEALSWDAHAQSRLKKSASNETLKGKSTASADTGRTTSQPMWPGADYTDAEMSGVESEGAGDTSDDDTSINGDDAPVLQQAILRLQQRASVRAALSRAAVETTTYHAASGFRARSPGLLSTVQNSDDEFGTDDSMSPPPDSGSEALSASPGSSHNSAVSGHSDQWDMVERGSISSISLQSASDSDWERDSQRRLF